MNISAPVHPPPGRHDAADDRGRAGRRHRAIGLLPGLAAAAGGVPDDPGVGEPAGRQPGDDGLVGGHAARAPVRPHRRRHRDDLDQLPRLDAASRCSSTSTATSTPPRATCRRPSTRPAASCRPNLPNNPTLPQGQSGRRADPDPGADVGRRRHAAGCTTLASTILQQKLAQIARRRPGGRRRRRAAGGARRRQPDGAEQLRARPRGRARPCSPRPTPTGRRASSPTATRTWKLGDHRSAASRPSEYRPLVVALSATARAVRLSDVADVAGLGRGPPHRRPRRTASRRSCSSSSASRAPTSSTRSTASARCCPQLQAVDPADDRRCRSRWIAPRPSAPRCTTSS